MMAVMQTTLTPAHLRRRSIFISVVVVAILSFGCNRYRSDIAYDYPVQYTWRDAVSAQEFSIFQGVSWDPMIADGFGETLSDQSIIEGHSVLDLFSGPGIIAVTCAREGATKVLSFDEQKVTVACAIYNVADHDQDFVVTVKQFDAKAAAFPTADHFDVILATLIHDLDSPDSSPTASLLGERIAVVLKCANENLEISGRVFVVCENETVAATFNETCRSQGHTTTPVTKESQRAPVLELKLQTASASSS